MEQYIPAPFERLGDRSFGASAWTISCLVTAVRGSGKTLVGLRVVY